MTTGRRGRGLRRPGRLWPVLLVVAIVAVVAGCSGDPDVPERAAEDAPARTTSTTAPPPRTLERVSVTPSVVGGALESRFTEVVFGASGILVVGESGGQAGVWTTSDGVRFDPVALDRRAFPAGTVLRDVVVTPRGFVLVGTAGGSGAAAWMSPDGRTWVRTDLAGGDVADVVILGGLGITAFGREGTVLATWTSFDGFGWQRVPGGPAVFDRAGAARVVGAHDDGDGYLAMVDRDGVAEAWGSPDGRVWEALPLTGSGLLPGAGPPLPATVLGAGSTTVVLGAVADPDGQDAAVWTSLSGAPWERVAPREAVFGGDGAQAVLGAAQLGSGLVAVGTDTDDQGDVDAVVWSTGAGGWRRSVGSDGDGLSGPGDQHAVALVATRDGALVVGWEEGPEGSKAVAWNLVDGEAEAAEPVRGPVLGWRRVPSSEALGGVGEQRIDDVVAFGNGFVAAGSAQRATGPDRDTDVAVWRSPDGVEWERMLAGDVGAARPGDQRISGIVAAGPGLVAVGADGGSAAIWTSPDGGTWAPVDPDEVVFGGPGDQTALAVAAGPDGSIVAVGSDAGGGDADAAVWRSTDAAGTWARVAAGGELGGPGPQGMADITVAGPLLVAVGGSGEGATAWSSRDGVAWQRADLGPGRAVSVHATAGGVVAVGSRPGGGGGLDAAAWLSTDGTTWAPVVIDDGDLGAADQELADVATTTPSSGEPVVAGVGWTNLGPGDDGAAWASVDGSTWARSPHDEDAYGGDQAQRMLALASLGDVAVAVGWSGSVPDSRDAAVWVSAPAGGASGVL